MKGAKKARAAGVEDARGRHHPGELVWMVGERRRGGEIKYDAPNPPEGTSTAQIVRDTKAHWSCEPLHAQAKEVLGLDQSKGGHGEV